MDYTVTFIVRLNDYMWMIEFNYMFNMGETYNSKKKKLCRTFVPRFLKLMIGLSSQVIHYLPNNLWAATTSLLDPFT